MKTISAAILWLYCIRWVDYRAIPAGQFAAVLFTHSLHHIHPLPEALAHAKTLIRPGGLLIVDDCAFEAVDEKSAAWFFAHWDARGNARNQDGAAHSHIPAASAPAHPHDPGRATPPPERWRLLHAHEPPLHLGAGMRAGIASLFKIEYEASAPNFFRYFAGLTLDGRDAAELIFSEEQAMIAAGQLPPVGRHIVARRVD